MRMIFLSICLLFLSITSAQSAETGYKDPVTGMEFVFVKGGCYEMGDTFNEGTIAELPVHKVCVSDFYMAKYEVTQGQWKTVIKTSEFYYGGKDIFPVDYASWNDIQTFISKLNGVSGKKYRLPTEAEWEYAAREGGRKVRFGTGTDKIGPDSAIFDTSENVKQPYSESGRYIPRPAGVGSFKPNKLGLYDMCGNVWEWVSDWYEEKYYKKSHRDNPKGPDSGKVKVLRGGAWASAPWIARATYRFSSAPSTHDFGFGFRLVYQDK